MPNLNWYVCFRRYPYHRIAFVGLRCVSLSYSTYPQLFSMLQCRFSMRSFVPFTNAYYARILVSHGSNVSLNVSLLHNRQLVSIQTVHTSTSPANTFHKSGTRPVSPVLCESSFLAVSTVDHCPVREAKVITRTASRPHLDW